MEQQQTSTLDNSEKEKQLCFIEFCAGLNYQEITQTDKEKVQNWMKKEENTHKIENTTKEIHKIINQVYDQIETLFLDGINGINKRQLRIKLFQSIGKLSTKEIKTKQHHILFKKYMEKNSQFSSHIIKEIIQLYSDKIVKVFDDKPHYFKEFFNHSKPRIEGWFQHFHYNGKMLYGAKSIERFTFTNRDR